jgi:dihydrofolate synthase/folylpolyglutamate synthase
MTYQEAVSYIEEIPKFTTKPGLDHTRLFLRELGNPEKKLRVIHVAGTNGKGSVCAYTESILRAAGFSVGMFTSPHLVRINERIQINRVPVGDDEFLAAFQTVMEAVRRLKAENVPHPTYFELLFLMAMVIFKERKPDWCILETGMGGRLDMTNVIDHPSVTAITSIGLDHTEYLGETIEKIASEKAGIIKRGVPVVFDAGRAEAAEVICRRAQELDAPVRAVAPGEAELISQDRSGISFRFDGKTYQIGTVARYQMMNAAVAIETAKTALSRAGGGIAGETQAKGTASGMIRTEDSCEQAVRVGLARASWPCRMEIFPDGVILDGAHNEDGIEAFIRTAVHFHRENKITILFAAVSDKDYSAMIRRIVQEVNPEHVVATSIEGARKVPAERLAEFFAAEGCADVSAEEGIEKAFRIAYSKKEDGILFCVGSLYLAGDVRGLMTRTFQ